MAAAAEEAGMLAPVAEDQDGRLPLLLPLELMAPGIPEEVGPAVDVGIAVSELVVEGKIDIGAVAPTAVADFGFAILELAEGRMSFAALVRPGLPGGAAEGIAIEVIPDFVPSGKT